MPPWRAVGVTAKGFRALQRQIEALQEQMHRGMNLTVRDESEDEREEGQVNQEEQEEEENLFKALTKIGKRPKFGLPTFFEKLNWEELINWISELEEYFEYEEIEDLDRVKFAKTKLKGHVEIWW